MSTRPVRNGISQSVPTIEGAGAGSAAPSVSATRRISIRF